ncbi:hypothetical protein jhhlp_004982 [Lomentospora prolificans]|uniref:F-box domain-containing protein n=1 Tax=Lomentospora prolificans TaxID=41688 RepID=A0A2N3N817_9PEZI|nr:hypothetical protein jhhlp_004982 [Lomentospora prolificans]
MHLLNLPVEVLQRIAALCTLSDILHLSMTCRHLHATCHDNFVFQESFLQHMDTPISNNVPTQNTVRDLIQAALAEKNEREKKAIWARLTAAASRIGPLTDELNLLLRPYNMLPHASALPWPLPLIRPVTTIASTLSSLAVLGYPTTDKAPVPLALSGFLTHVLDARFQEQRTSLDPVQVAQASFCLATGNLANRVLHNMAPLTKRTAEYMIQDHNVNFFDSQAAGFLAAACMPWLLSSDPRVAIRDDLPYLPALPLMNVDKSIMQSGAGGSIPIPDGGELGPLNEALPLPVQETSGLSKLVSSMNAFNCAPSWQSWLRTCVDGLIDDLENGEWIGYYSVGLRNDTGVDAPLRNIRFRTAQDPIDENNVRLTAENCMDGVGRFRLEGRVSRLTGSVDLKKEYYGSHRWQNTGWLTPLGIAGYWDADSTECAGFIWMYKKEWAKKPAAKVAPVQDDVAEASDGEE